MVNSKVFYKEYISGLKREISVIKTGISSLNKVKKIIVNKLTPNEDNVLLITKRSLDSIKNDTELNLSSLESNTQFFVVPLGGLTKSKLLRELEKVVGLNVILDKRYKKLDKLKKEILSYTIYKDVISIFNKSMVDEILKGESFNLGFGIGIIKIRKKKRNLLKPVIDWNESKKLKQQIINEGGTPYEVTKRDVEGKPLENNGGEKYFVYRTDEYSCWWYWYKSHSTLANLELYSFSPTTGENGNVKKLSRYRNDNEYADLNYTM